MGRQYGEQKPEDGRIKSDFRGGYYVTSRVLSFLIFTIFLCEKKIIVSEKTWKMRKLVFVR